ncbi:hypothetical protein DFH07DRAFT_769368 [Mycena maculata]|uniref:Uncharacterized protein n=1 Tax=Mycena maculata TaxID=230809 RepID=A0AAD7JMN2_9AGAR|nr:hypothetical protein DFH07DRAFT_769368 [Mycena maculata]
MARIPPMTPGDSGPGVGNELLALLSFEVESHEKIHALLDSEYWQPRTGFPDARKVGAGGKYKIIPCEIMAITWWFSACAGTTTRASNASAKSQKERKETEMHHPNHEVGRSNVTATPLMLSSTMGKLRQGRRFWQEKPISGTRSLSVIGSGIKSELPVPVRRGQAVFLESGNEESVTARSPFMWSILSHIYAEPVLEAK